MCKAEGDIERVVFRVIQEDIYIYFARINSGNVRPKLIQTREKEAKYMEILKIGTE